MYVRPFLAIATPLMMALLSCPTANAQEKSLTQKQITALLRTAHTAREYRELADHYQLQAKKFHSMEQTESEEVQRSLHDHTPTKSSRFEQARNLEIYYKSKWEESVEHERFYTEKLRQAEAQR